MQAFGTEWDVYDGTIGFLQGRRAVIVCASPPGGTDARFKTCIFPKPQEAGLKGPRDEVDITAVLDGYLLMIEAKPALSHCLTRLNRAGESDWMKLQRLLAIDDGTFLPKLSIAYSIDLGGLVRCPALAYHTEDDDLPAGALGLWVRAPGDVVARGAIPSERLS